MNGKNIISSVTLSALTAGRTEPHLREAKPPSLRQAGGRWAAAAAAAAGARPGSPGGRRGCAVPRSAGCWPGPPAAPPAAAAPAPTPRGARRRWWGAGWSACPGARSSRCASARGGGNPGPGKHRHHALSALQENFWRTPRFGMNSQTPWNLKAYKHSKFRNKAHLFTVT